MKAGLLQDFRLNQVQELGLGLLVSSKKIFFREERRALAENRICLCMGDCDS